jgi:cold shock protein
MLTVEFTQRTLWIGGDANPDAVHTGPMASTGIVRTFDPDVGWGVIDGPDVPGGCWVHFSAIAADGYRQLADGQPVSFIAEEVSQDGFAFRAVKVWTGDTEPHRKLG